MGRKMHQNLPDSNSKFISHKQQVRMGELELSLQNQKEWHVADLQEIVATLTKPTLPKSQTQRNQTDSETRVQIAVAAPNDDC